MLLAGGLFAAGPCAVEAHVSNTAAMNPAALFQAKATAVEIFAEAGMRLHWLKAAPRPNGSGCSKPIEIRFETKTPAEERPAALAYAMPYLADGASIYVYVDRVTVMARPNHLGALLGHVLAHEIAHVLEGVSRHSESGVMKARWEKDDLSAMEIRPLRFADTDLILLQAGRHAPEATLVATR
jgi:hypothetical protein